MTARGKRAYLLSVLTVIFAFNQVDRIALGIVQQDIKIALDLSDTQIGLLTGIAFAFFYAIVGVWIARLADRGNRIVIISLTTALWSLCLGVSAAVTSFIQLMLVRIGVAVGEAGCVPSSHSLIADAFPSSERPRAFARFMLGVPLALSVGYFAAGWLNELVGWRQTFLILALPGLILAPLAFLTLSDDRKNFPAPKQPGAEGIQGRHLSRDLKQLWQNRTFRHLLICNSLWAVFGIGILQWTPTFFIRTHGIGTGELGTWFALIFGVAGGAGVYLGGELAAKYGVNNEKRQLSACAIAFIFFGAAHAVAFAASDYTVALAAITLAAFGGNMAQGPIFANIQVVVDGRMRATAIAIIAFFQNLVGAGLGPLAAGFLSDTLQPLLGNDALRYALIILCPGYFWAAWHLWRAGRTISSDATQTEVEAGYVAPTSPLENYRV